MARPIQAPGSHLPPMVVELTMLRTGAGWSRKKTAKAIGISADLLESWESGFSTPRLPELAAWAGAFGRCLSLSSLPGWSSCCVHPTADHVDTGCFKSGCPCKTPGDLA